MSLTGQINSTMRIAGMDFSSTISKTASASVGHDDSLAAGIAGSLSTRTDDDTGVVTVASGHGVTTSDTVDIFWTSGVRYGMTVSAQDDTTITVDGGAGDNLPTEDDTVVVGKRVALDLNFDGDDAVWIALLSDLRAHVTFLDSGAAVLEAVELNALAAWTWVYGAGASNPLTGNAVDSVMVSAGTAAATRLQIGVLYDA